jgi:hypothetical protein
MAEKASELSVIRAKLAVRTPQSLDATLAAMGAYSLEEQAMQINQWIGKRDEFYQFVGIFKDLLCFITSANFTDTLPNSQYCKLIHAVRQFRLADSASAIVPKLVKAGLTEESPVSAIFKRMTIENGQIPFISSIPLVNGLLAWLSVVVQFCQWTDELNALSGALTQLKNRSNASQAGLATLRKEHQELLDIQATKNAGTQCPQWLSNAWTKDQSDVKKLFDLLDGGVRTLTRIVELILGGNRSYSLFAVLSVAYPWGFCSLAPANRHRILIKLGLHEFLEPFSFVPRLIELELFTPIQRDVSLFTPTISGSTEFLGSRTGQLFNASTIFDQLLFHDLLRHVPRFFIENSDSPSSFLKLPFHVYYDPFDITVQTILSTHPSVQVCFSSSQPTDAIIRAVEKATKLLVYLDNIALANDLFSFLRHCILQVQTTGNFL